MARRWSGMTTLKCSRCTMLPTAWASRSYCFTFSGAFTGSLHAPYAARELRVIGCHLLGNGAAQKLEFFLRGQRGTRHLAGGIVVEARGTAHILAVVRALEPEAALFRLPGKEGLARQQRHGAAAALDLRRAPARRRDEVNLLHEHPRRMLLAKQDHSGHGEIHERRAEGAREPCKGARLRAGSHPHQVEVGLAVDLRAAEEKDVDASLPREVEELTRTLGKGIAF